MMISLRVFWGKFKTCNIEFIFLKLEFQLNYSEFDKTNIITIILHGQIKKPLANLLLEFKFVMQYF